MDDSVKIRLTQDQLSVIINTMIMDNNGKPRVYALGDANIVIPIVAMLQKYVHDTSKDEKTEETPQDPVLTNATEVKPVN